MLTPVTPGSYLYTDPIGAPPERVDVREVDGELVACFAGQPDDCTLLVDDMAGTFTPA
jgi:hypothetical protein